MRSTLKSGLLTTLAVLFAVLVAAAPVSAASAPVSGPSVSTAEPFALGLGTIGIVIGGATLAELIEERKKKLDEAETLDKQAKDEKRSLTADEESTVDNLLGEIEELDTAIEQRKKDDEAVEQRSNERRGRFDAIRRRRSAPPPRGPEPGESEQRSNMLTSPESDGQEYSLLRAIEKRARGEQLDGYEAEVSQEIAKQQGRDPDGFFMPLTLRSRNLNGVEYRDLDTTAAAGVIPTITAPTMIGALRNKTRIIQLGANLLSDMEGNFEIPKQTGVGSAYWFGEGGAPTESEQDIDQVAFSPTSLGAFTDITRRARKQTSRDLEMFVRNDLRQVISIALDLAAVNGTGASNQPLGILQDSNIETIAIGANGGALTRDHIIDLETEVANDNADEATLAYLTNPKVRGKLKKTAEDAGSGQFVWGKDNLLNGYRTAVSNQLPSNLTKGIGTDLSAMIFGDFSSVFIAFWGGVDVIVDPYSNSTTGAVRVVLMLDCQIKFRHDEALKKIVDIDTT